MNLRFVHSSWLLLFLVGLAIAQPAQAQLGDLKWRLHGGMVQPIGSTGDYFNFGASGGLDVGLPITDRVDVVVDVDMDLFATSDIYPTPNTNLWRYRAELEASLVGNDESMFVVRALGGAGFTTFVSRKFWLVSRQPYTYEGERLNSTSMTATGGLRLGFRTPDSLTWWLSGKLNWTPMNDANQEALRELSRNDLDLLGSATSFTITLGVGL